MKKDGGGGNDGRTFAGKGGSCDLEHMEENWRMWGRWKDMGKDRKDIKKNVRMRQMNRGCGEG